MRKIMIARHGNTFDSGDTIRRVGLKTDIPLSNSGKVQAEALGEYLKEHFSNPTHVFSSELTRTCETLEIALSYLDVDVMAERLSFLNEVDYGCDDGQPEESVRARIGLQALKDWEEKAIVPPGWEFSPQEIILSWTNFISELPSEANVLIVTSNGIARFLPITLLKNIDALALNLSDFKLKTGYVGLFSESTIDCGWQMHYWNRNPKDAHSDEHKIEMT